MYKIAIVEDEPFYQDQLQEYIRDFEQQENVKFQVEVYSDGLDLVEDFKADYDIIFLDVMMTCMDGIKTAEKIRELDDSVIIIFITSVSNYAIKGYSVSAFNYVIKPISRLDFFQQLNKAIRHLQSRECQYLTLQRKGNVFRLNLTQICYIESLGHDIIIHLGEEAHTLRYTLKKLESLLEPFHYVRCNNCYIINLRFVEKINQDVVTVAGKELKISRSRRSHLMDALLEYNGDMML